MSSTHSDDSSLQLDKPQVDATSRIPAAGERALVLGGGGSTGNAWLIGLVAGLHEEGLDVTTADLTVGTSAGATAAAQLAGATPPDLLPAVLAEQSPQRTGPMGPEGGRPASPATDHLERMRRAVAAAHDAAEWRRAMGSIGLDLDAASDGSGQSRWRATVAARLPGSTWPDRAVVLTAIDARTGEAVLLDRHSGVDLVDAVAASCAGVSVYRVSGVPYLDGGYRTNAENADLAAGHERVLVLSPLGGRSWTPPEWGLHLADQVAALRAGGSRVEVVVPDADSEHLFGANAMNPSLRPAAARVGHDQGRSLADRLTELWR